VLGVIFTASEAVIGALTASLIPIALANYFEEVSTLISRVIAQFEQGLTTPAAQEELQSPTDGDGTPNVETPVSETNDV
jgi:hypothetical protein